MLKISITLKSFELCYIKKNILFLKKIYLLLNRESSINRSKIVSEYGFAKPSYTIKTCNKDTATNFLKVQPSRVAGCSDTITALVRPSKQSKKLGRSDAKANFLDLNRKDKVKLASVDRLGFVRSDRFLKYYVHAYQAYFNFTKISFPKKHKLFTVLRGPHVDKKSREQFHFTTHTKKLGIQCKNVKHVLFFLFILKNAELYGVETQISFCYNSVFKHEKLLGTN